MIYGLVEAEKANHKVGTMCRVLKVSKSGYYGWLRRPPSARDRADAALAGRIGRVHRDSRGTYGAPRVHAELAIPGRSMREEEGRQVDAGGGTGGLRGSKKGTHHPQQRSRTRAGSPRPGQAQLRPGSSRSSLGRGHNVRQELGGLALPGVHARRLLEEGGGLVDGEPPEDGSGPGRREHGDPQPAAGLVHHSDRGSQYTSVEFGGRLKEAGLLPSMGSVADAYDNALAESFVSTLKRELLHRHSWPSRGAVRAGIFEYIECFYNPRRRHSSLGQMSPVEYEEARMRGAAVA